jgi:hypothetical protein
MRKAMLSLHTRRMLSDRRAERLLGRHTSVVMDEPLEISSAGITALERVLERYPAESLLSNDTVAAQALRGAIRILAMEARAHDAVRGERLLIAVRCAWRDFPEVRRLSEEGVRDDLWRHLVRLCCEEFYGPRVARRTLRSA